MFFVLSRPFGPSNRPRWHGLRNKAWAFPSVFRLLGKREGGAFGWSFGLRSVSCLADLFFALFPIASKR